MIIYNVTSIDNLTLTFTNATNNSTLPWYINGEGAMAFSIVVILVFGMSIIFFIMLSINKTRTDREEEKQIWSYLKTFRQVRSEALKDDEQRIRAKLLFMSILGEQVTNTQLQPQNSTKVNGKVSKLKERRRKSISGCLRVDSYGSDAWHRQFSAENIMEALDENLVTIHSSSGNPSEFNSEGDIEATIQNETGTKGDHNENDLSTDVADTNGHDAIQSYPTSRRAGSVPNTKETPPATHLPQVASLKVIKAPKDDAFETNKGLSHSELETIRARRRKRSGYNPPKLELLDIPLLPRSASNQDKIHAEHEASPVEGSSAPSTPVNFAIGDDQLFKPTNAGHYKKSTHASKGHRISEETPRPKLTRRAQSFRFHDRKRSSRRKNSFDLPGSLHQSNERLAFQDNDFVRSLNCRRHDRQSRISVICLPHNSDSDSSNDIILPAITLPQEQLDVSSSEDTNHSDFVQDVMEEVSRRASVVSNGSVTDSAQSTNNGISDDFSDESKSSRKKSDLQESLNLEELAPLVSGQEVPLDPASEPDPMTLKRSSRNRRSGVINVQYRR